MSTTTVGTVKIGAISLRVTSVAVSGGAFVVRAQAASTSVIIPAGTSTMQLLGADGTLVVAGQVTLDASISGTAKTPAKMTMRVKPTGAAFSALGVSLVDVP